jgi:diguanylate cyclase (GGDEF)-like protein
MMKIKNKILLATEISIFAVITIVMFFTIAWIEPVTPIKHTFKIVIPFLLIAYFFLFIAFRILSYYYLQLLHQKHIIEKLNTSFISLHSKVKMDDLLKQSLETLMDFFSGSTGIMLIIDERIKEYVSGEILTLNINTLQENTIAKNSEKNHRMFTFYPSEIPRDIDKKIRELLDRYDLKECGAIITLPVSSKDKIAAVIVIGVPVKPKKGLEKNLEDMKNIMDIFLRKLNIEIENSILHEKINEASITDPLTKLYNRRHFNIRAKEEFAKAKRMGFPVSIMISDLDNFKNYVDTYGHPKGDIILAEVASLINNMMRESDIVCRFGGDEFAYLLPFTSSVEATTLAERIKENVSHYNFLKNAITQSIHLTLSMGIASFPEHGETEQEIISKADNALFFSKNKGKNRISIYSEDSSSKS